MSDKEALREGMRCASALGSLASNMVALALKHDRLCASAEQARDILAGRGDSAALTERQKIDKAWGILICALEADER